MILRLFGAFAAQIDGRPLPLARYRKTHWLLALLALRRGRAVERAALAGLLWPDSSHAQALYNLRRSLGELRAVLGPEARRLDSPSPQTLALDLTGAEIDALTFDAAISRGDESSLEAAVALYQGPLLAECDQEWVLPERAQREEAFLAALESLAALAAGRGDHAAALHGLRQAIATDPFRETAQQALLRALMASGDAAAALLAYREFRLRLHEELGAQPSPETKALFQQLRAQARRRTVSRPSREERRRSVPSAPRHLPRPLSHFIGREGALRAVEACLEDARLVTVTGPGGVGKTRLAIQVADDIADDYAEGVWFVDLSRLTDPALVPQAVAAVLAVGEQPHRPLPDTLAEFLRARHLLLVLDNCEHLISACAGLVEALLSHCPALRILATSRQSLGLTGEVVWPLSGLSVPPARGLGPPTPTPTRSVAPTFWSASTPGGSPSLQTFEHEHEHEQPAPDPLLQYEAVRLLVERARAATGTFTLSETSAPSIVQICRRLDGIPLAIELAAARMKALSVEEIAARLDDRFRLLTGGSRTALPRQQTLRATMDWSYALLTERERLLLQRLSVFAGSFTLKAVEAVCGEGGRVKGEGCRIPNGSALHPSPFTLPPHDVLDLLTQLVDRSLVVVEKPPDRPRWNPSPEPPPTSGEGRTKLCRGLSPPPPVVGGGAGGGGLPGTETRYRLLETVRDYAGERLRESGEAEAARRRHADYYLRLAETAAPHLCGPEQAAWLSRLDAEHDNLRAALEEALETAPEHALRMAAALARFWEERRHLEEGRRRLAAALEQAGVDRRSATGAAALEGASALALLQEDRPAAHTLRAESLAIRRELGDQAGLAASLDHLAHLAFLRDDYPAARVLYAESLAIYQERGNPAGIATVLTGLGQVAWRQGEYAEAGALQAESLTIRRALGDRYGIAEALIGLGDVALWQGDAPAARAHFAEALALRRALGDQAGIAGALSHLGEAARKLGDYAAARRLREESMALWRAVGSNVAVLHSLGALGHLAREQGHYAEARSFYAESLLLRQELGDPYTLAQSLEDFAELAEAEGQWGRLARLLGAAQALRDAVEKPLRPQEQADYDRMLAAAHAALGEAAIAAGCAEGRAMTLEQAMALALGESGPRDR
jgi:predicted ATPase/DNA-binding SARP family transcriptional activator